MTIHRFFVPTSHFDSPLVSLRGEEGYHLIKILRAKPGMKIAVFTEKGKEYLCEVVKIKGSEAFAEIKEELTNRVEPTVYIEIIQAMVKPAKMDYIIQKCTELGAASFRPVLTKYSMSRPNQEEKQLKRWDRIALEAAKQSERRKVPPIYSIIKLEQILEEPGEEMKYLYLDARAGEHSREVLGKLKDTSANRFRVAVGPEGGFSDEEKKVLQEKGYLPINLGPRILRTETAGPAIIAILLHEFEKS
ncbi:MAG: 16S rRNA (uracil(1498)-N(3))-methyltransferase [Acidobacteria bacterium]|nr:16S rRNA (uracil(1498)-N(3))-methyltransferase [Acidobacteriota bacterium]